tara:strand:- start:119 stop:901 length:783 start_codon:yes stop_codon:yes gene_type:complete
MGRGTLPLANDFVISTLSNDLATQYDNGFIVEKFSADGWDTTVLSGGCAILAGVGGAGVVTNGGEYAFRFRGGVAAYGTAARPQRSLSTIYTVSKTVMINFKFKAGQDMDWELDKPDSGEDMFLEYRMGPWQPEAYPPPTNWKPIKQFKALNYNSDSAESGWNQASVMFTSGVPVYIRWAQYAASSNSSDNWALRDIEIRHSSTLTGSAFYPGPGRTGNSSSWGPPEDQLDAAPPIGLQSNRVASVCARSGKHAYKVTIG